MQDDDLAKGEGQFGDGAPDQPCRLPLQDDGFRIYSFVGDFPGRLFFSVFAFGRVVQRLGGHGGFAEMAAAEVDGDGQEPVAEGFGGGQFGQLLPRPQKSVLRDIFGVFGVAQKLQGSVVNGAVKEAEEFLKGFLVTFLRR